MLTAKQKIIVKFFKKFYRTIHTDKCDFTTEHCKKLTKETVNQLYKMFPDKNVGKLSVNWFDSDGDKPEKINNHVICFEIDFHDRFDNMPWMICRFYKNDSKIRMYIND